MGHSDYQKVIGEKVKKSNIEIKYGIDVLIVSFFSFLM